MAVSDLRGERPSALRPLLWGGHGHGLSLGLGHSGLDASSADSSADALASMMDVVPADADGDANMDAPPSPADEARHEYRLYQADIENDRGAGSRANQPSASAGPPSASGSPSASGGPPSAADDDKAARLGAPLSRHTPVTRFLSRETLGFIPRLSARPSPLADAVAAEPESLTSPLAGGFRLPALGGTPPLSPRKWTRGSSGADERGPPFLGPPLRVASCGSLADKFASMSTAHAGPIPSLQEALQRVAGRRSASSGGCAAGGSAADSPRTGRLTMEDICRPVAYQRSASCPSDPTLSRSGPHFPSATAERFVDDGPSSPGSSAGTPFEDESEDEDAADRPPASPPAHAAAPRLLSLRDIAQGRLARSSSLDGRPARRPAAEAIDLYQWLDRSSLHSLAESARAMQLLAASSSPQTQTQTPSAFPPAPTAASGFGGPALTAAEAADRREKKLCAFPQCASNAVTRGLCISHGGGRRCQRKGCTRGAQSKGLCVAHGGGRICRAKGCSNIQRSMGLCIRHGGGRRCCVAGCHKGVVRQDLCTAHGGKRKCRVDDCNKHVKKKGLCRAHANAMAAGGGA